MIKKIYVYNTSIQVTPYKKDECFQLEKLFSIWDDLRKRYLPFLYTISGETLYLPKGCSSELIQSLLSHDGFLTEVVVMYEHTHTPVRFEEFYQMKEEPRDEIQREAISFLTHKGKYKNNISASQFALNVDTGIGKTYFSIAMIVAKKMRTMCIMNRVALINGWKNEIIKHSTIPEERIHIITSSNDLQMMRNGELDKDVFICSHQMLSLYMNEYGKIALYEVFDHSGIGLKIFDECHQNIKNISIIDSFTNVKYTLYLSATFKRTQYNENRMYNIYFGSTVKYSYSRENENEKHTVYIPCIYRTTPSTSDLSGLRTRYGFSAYRFIDYALREPSNKLMRSFHFILSEAIIRDGKILIVTPTKNSVVMLYDYLCNNFHCTGKSIATIYSDNTKESNEEAKNADIIVSTIKSSGTGVTIYNLQTIICMEPHMSSNITKQLRGRLDRYMKGEPTYFYDLLDVSIPEIARCYKNHTLAMREMVKDITVKNIPI